MTEREAFIVEQFGGGALLQEIGDQIGVTRQRVSAILSKFGISGRDGGAAFRRQIRAAERERARNARFVERWGHDRATHRRLSRKIKDAYRRQEENAHAHGYPWHLTLAEWWAIWQQSGQWTRRGKRRDGYVLARIDKRGPFSQDNVHIVTLRENSIDTRRYLRPMQKGRES